MHLTPHALPWPPAPPQARERLARQLQTLEQLQQKVGAFSSEVSRQPLPSDVAAQMPELLRIAAYYDTLARVMHQTGQQILSAPRPMPGQPLAGGRGDARLRGGAGLLRSGRPAGGQRARAHRHRARGLRYGL